jgi:hypothetical protein
LGLTDGGDTFSGESRGSWAAIRGAVNPSF